MRPINTLACCVTLIASASAHTHTIAAAVLLGVLFVCLQMGVVLLSHIVDLNTTGKAIDFLIVAVAATSRLITLLSLVYSMSIDL